MVRYIILISALLIYGASISIAQTSRKLIWADEFNEDGLPSSKIWSYEKGYVRNNEVQYYTEKVVQNARVENGHLVIAARYDSTAKNPYTSASLITLNKKDILYGRIEVRAKLPVGRGTWPAIWLLGTAYNAKYGWPECGEIDVMENVGFDSLRIHANIHTEAYNHVKKTNKGNSIAVQSPYEAFHVYSMEWSKDKIDFFVDDIKYFTYPKEPNATHAEWPFDDPHYLILNLAIGGAWGGQQGIDNRIFPHEYLVDYVRVYR
jgi:beta-glucanase (GH16 family)